MRNPTTWMLFLHVLAALWLAAGSFAGAIVRAQTKRATELRDKVFGLRLAWRLTTVYTLPGAIVAGLLGFYLVTARGFTFSTRWVQISSLLYLVLLAIALGYLAPRLRRTLRAAEAALAAGGPSDELRRLTASPLPGILADVNALGIVVLTLLMVIKP
jgi:uncharacterized membrane protein